MNVGVLVRKWTGRKKKRKEKRLWVGTEVFGGGGEEKRHTCLGNHLGDSRGRGMSRTSLGIRRIPHCLKVIDRDNSVCDLMKA